MNKKKSIGIASVLTALLVLQTSCASQSRAANFENSPAKAVIEIAYSPTFSGQTASGYLNLMVDIEIENKGAGPFDISPAMFSVLVDEYSYPVVQSDLGTMGISSGDSISGKLAFQVPPEAATTRVGYRMAFSGQDQQNVEWVKISKPMGSEITPTAFAPAIVITYSEDFMWVKETGSLYLLVDMAIENRGYESFNTSPNFFYLVMGDIFGDSSPRPSIPFDGRLSEQRDGSYSDLRSFDLQNGGKINGTLAFNIPVDIFKTTESNKIDYSGVRTYNIQWIKRPPKPMN